MATPIFTSAPIDATQRMMDADLYTAGQQAVDPENIAATGNVNIGLVVDYDVNAERQLRGTTIDEESGHVQVRDNSPPEAAVLPVSDDIQGDHAPTLQTANTFGAPASRDIDAAQVFNRVAVPSAPVSEGSGAAPVTVQSAAISDGDSSSNTQVTASDTSSKETTIYNGDTETTINNQTITNTVSNNVQNTYYGDVINNGGGNGDGGNGAGDIIYNIHNEQNTTTTEINNTTITNNNSTTVISTTTNNSGDIVNIGPITIGGGDDDNGGGDTDDHDPLIDVGDILLGDTNVSNVVNNVVNTVNDILPGTENILNQIINLGGDGNDGTLLNLGDLNINETVTNILDGLTEILPDLGGNGGPLIDVGDLQLSDTNLSNTVNDIAGGLNDILPGTQGLIDQIIDIGHDGDSGTLLNLGDLNVNEVVENIVDGLGNILPAIGGNSGPLVDVGDLQLGDTNLSIVVNDVIGGLNNILPGTEALLNPIINLGDEGDSGALLNLDDLNIGAILPDTGSGPLIDAGALNVDGANLGNTVNDILHTVESILPGSDALIGQIIDVNDADHNGTLLNLGDANVDHTLASVTDELQNAVGGLLGNDAIDLNVLAAGVPVDNNIAGNNLLDVSSGLLGNQASQSSDNDNDLIDLDLGNTQNSAVSDNDLIDLNILSPQGADQASGTNNDFIDANILSGDTSQDGDHVLGLDLLNTSANSSLNIANIDLSPVAGSVANVTAGVQDNALQIDINVDISQTLHDTTSLLNLPSIELPSALTGGDTPLGVHLQIDPQLTASAPLVTANVENLLNLPDIAASAPAAITDVITQQSALLDSLLHQVNTLAPSLDGGTQSPIDGGLLHVASNVVTAVVAPVEHHAPVTAPVTGLLTGLFGHH